jgi:hypothetical protein
MTETDDAMVGSVKVIVLIAAVHVVIRLILLYN